MPQQRKPNMHMVLTYKDTEAIVLTVDQQEPLPKREEYCFVFVLQQKVEVTVLNSGIRTLTEAAESELFLLPPSCTCTFYNSGMQQAEVVMIWFQSESLRHSRSHTAASEMLPHRNSTGLHRIRMPQARGWIQDFLSNSRTVDLALHYQLQSHLYAMASGLIQAAQQSKDTEADLISYVKKTKQFMIEKFHSSMDMEELARSSGVSASRFYQAFRSYTGLSPLKYVIKLRLDASLRMLSGTFASIVDVAHSVGYPDEYYFSRLFKKQMGMAPTEYALLAKKRVAALDPIFIDDLAALGMTACLSHSLDDQTSHELMLQQLREAMPELILSGPIDDERLAAYSSIAQVLVFEGKSLPRKERLLQIGEALGLSSIAERWISYC